MTDPCIETLTALRFGAALHADDLAVPATGRAAAATLALCCDRAIASLPQPPARHEFVCGGYGGCTSDPTLHPWHETHEICAYEPSCVCCTCGLHFSHECHQPAPLLAAMGLEQPPLPSVRKVACICNPLVGTLVTCPIHGNPAGAQVIDAIVSAAPGKVPPMATSYTWHGHYMAPANTHGSGEWVRTGDYDTLHALATSQAAEIEHLRDAALLWENECGVVCGEAVDEAERADAAEARVAELSAQLAAGAEPVAMQATVLPAGCCPQCGPTNFSDEDGCCGSCGSTIADWSDIEKWYALFHAAPAPATKPDAVWTLRWNGAAPEMVGDTHDARKRLLGSEESVELEVRRRVK